MHHSKLKMIRIVKNNNPKDYRRKNHRWVKICLEFIEFLAVVLAIPISIYLVKEYMIPDMDIALWEGGIFTVLLLISWYVFSRTVSMARLPRTQRYLTMVIQFSRVYFIILISLLAVKVLFRFTSIPVELIFVYVFISITAVILLRLTMFRTLKIYRANGYNLHHVVVIADAFSDSTIESLINQKEWGFKINTILTNSKLIRAKYGDEINILPESADLKSIMDRMIIDEVLYSKIEIDENLVKRIVEICNEVGVIFRFQSSVSPVDPFEMQLRTLDQSKYLSLVDIPASNTSMIIKFVGDFYLSIFALILAFPIFILIGIIIKLDSEGPVFFVQERIGLRGRKFRLYKFRTMVPDAEKRLKKLMEKNQADGPVFKIKNDPRITGVGNFLRKTGLDELPQLVNVVKGEMSLIGPRPPLESEVKSYERWQLRRLSVKPGITCSWQIVPNRNDVKFEKWMQMDLNYIDNWSLSKDIRLIWKTIGTFFTAGGH